MPRPKKERCVDCPPRWARYKPVGASTRMLKQINLQLDEYEAIRLADHDGLDHMNASKQMGISRSTFTRLIEQAHKKVAQFLMQGGELHLGGGNVQFRDNLYQCNDCGVVIKRPYDSPLTECPECGSAQLINYAEKMLEESRTRARRSR